MPSPTVLITGGPRGIGRATALLAAREGYTVGVAGLADQLPTARDVVREIEAGGGRAHAFAADVSRPDEIERLFREADAAMGPLTGLVNSAGLPHSAKVSDFEFETLQQLMAVNVVGLMLCCKEAVRRMSTARGGHGGAIVNISSLAVTIGGRPGASAYAASKAAVDNFSTGFAREVAAEGIRVNTVRPGAIATAMTANITGNPRLLAQVEGSIPLGRLGRPEEIAECALWLLSDRASLVTGAHMNAGGGGFHVAGNT